MGTQSSAGRAPHGRCSHAEQGISSILLTRALLLTPFLMGPLAWGARRSCPEPGAGAASWGRGTAMVCSCSCTTLAASLGSISLSLGQVVIHIPPTGSQLPGHLNNKRH